MSRWSRQAARRRVRARGPSMRRRIERRAGTIGLAAAGGTVLVLAVTLAIYAATRPPKLPVPRWPQFTATIVRDEGGTSFRQQVWWRGPTWCSRVIPAKGVVSATWSTTYRRALLDLGSLPDGKSAFEITQGAGAGPVDGFGEAFSSQVRDLYRYGKSRDVRILRRATVAGRHAFVVRQLAASQGGSTEKTWWIDTVLGITLGYQERDSHDIYTNWKLDDLRLGAKSPPWRARDVRQLQSVAGGPYGLVSVGSDPSGRNSQTVPPGQQPAFIDLAQRAFTVCAAGSSTAVPTPAPTPRSQPPPPAPASPGTSPGSG